MSDIESLTRAISQTERRLKWVRLGVGCAIATCIFCLWYGTWCFTHTWNAILLYLGALVNCRVAYVGLSEVELSKLALGKWHLELALRQQQQ